jgi:hypothetical protein
MTAEAGIDSTSGISKQDHEQPCITKPGRREVVFVDLLLQELEVIGLRIVRYDDRILHGLPLA